MKKTRIILHAKDVQIITGRSEQYGRMLLERIRHQLNKGEHQFITIPEFCAYTGIDPELIRDVIK